MMPRSGAYSPDAEMLAEELTVDLTVLEDRDPATITPREWERAIAAHERLLMLNMAARRGRL